jgi:hypothetical protein
MTDKTWVVNYEGQDVTLDTETYVELQRLAYDDPVAAKELIERVIDART